jgi:hypothetical protein
MMDRREFVYGAASAAFASSRSIVDQPAVSVQLSLPSSNPRLMPVDFTGLSYEAGQLYNPEFFSSRNVPLVNAFRGLSSKGVLRLGGHLSNITTWEGVGQDDPKQQRGVRHGIEDYWEWPLVDPTVQQNKRGILTRKAISNLRGFLDAVDWRLIYGLNFACGSAARAADEAESVATLVGDRLVAFVIGNEADGFGEDPFFRAKGYRFNRYFTEYEIWVKAIRKRVPKARFAGPDTDGKVDTWVMEYARRTRENAVLLTSHFYGMGPASDNRMTAERLLRKVNAELDTEIAGVQAARLAAGGTPYRMDEGNSCFGGGRKGVSDAYASALWVADYMLRVACAGFAGVNLHGGGVGIYTPIESSVKTPASPRPVYYGMQFALLFAGWQVAPCVLDSNANLTAYIGTKGGQGMLAVINKGPNAVQLKLPDRLGPGVVTQRWELRGELSGPSLDAKDGVRFERGQVPGGKSIRDVNGYSAVILQVG